MRWVTAFLVIVATPLVVLAAAAIVPVGWLAATGALFVVAGLTAYFVARRPPPVRPAGMDQPARAPITQPPGVDRHGE
jgi:hypothetical protein